MSESPVALVNDSVLYAQDGPVALITLNRPGRRNAINQDLIDGLSASLTQAQEDKAIRAIILTGAGRGFCSGADLEVFSGDFTPEYGRDYLIEHYQPLLRQFITLRKPIIGAINGAAAGAGVGLALACDLRVIADDASLLYAFINIGLAPDAGASWFLTRHVGYCRAFELAIEGKPIPASRCVELGLANRMVSAEDLLEEALSWAKHLAQRPTLAIGLTKQALHHALLSDLMSTIAFEAEVQMEAFGSHDLKEGVQAFLQKRPPRFLGR